MFGEPDDRRYLLFDSGCALCARVATELEAEAGGRLVARSLGDPAIQALLHKTKASPRWEPAVLEERRGRVRVWYGRRMRLRLLWLVGPAAAWRILRRIHRMQRESVDVNLDRRQVLSGGLALLGGLALWIGLGGFLGAGQALAAKGRPQVPSAPPDPSLNPLPDDWRTAVRIMGTQELSGAALGEARGALWEAQDTRELGWALTQLGLQTQAPAVGAAQHELETGNTLLAVAAIWQAASGAGYVLNHYALRHAVRGFRSSSSLYRVEAETVRLIASSVNGRLLMTPVGAPEAGILSHCGGCVDPNEGPWSQDASECDSWNLWCLWTACGTCQLLGFGTPQWWACVLLFCLPGLYFCCNSWRHYCASCPEPLPPGPQE